MKTEIKINIKSLALLSLFIYNIAMYLVLHNTPILLIFIVFASMYILTYKKIYFEKSMLLFVLFFFIICVSFFGSMDKSSALSVIQLLLKYYVFCVLVYLIINTKDSFDFAIFSLCWSGIVMSIYAFYYYGFSFIFFAIANGIRLGTEINQVNAFGLYSAISFAICIYYALLQGKKKYYLISLLPLFTVLASSSRKAIFIVLLSIFVFQIARNKIKKIYITLILITILIILFQQALTLPYMANVNERLTGVFGLFTGEGDVDNSTAMRKRLIELGITYFKESPLIGHGTGSYRFLTQSVFGVQTASHNNYIELLVNYGLVGFISYYSVYIYLIYKLYMMVKKGDNDAILLLFFQIITLFLIDIAMISYLNGITYMILGITIAYLKINREKKLKEI